MNLKNYILIVILVVSTTLIAQTATGAIDNYVGAIIDNTPGNLGDDYNEPNSTEPEYVE